MADASLLPAAVSAGGGDPLAAAQVANFFAGDAASRGGVRLAAADLDGDGVADIVTGAGAGAGSRVSVYTGKRLRAGDTQGPDLELDAFPGSGGGVFVG